MKTRLTLFALTLTLVLLVLPDAALASRIGDIVFGRFGDLRSFVWGLVLIIGLPGAILLAVIYVLRSR
jgi:hypothetical protein